jgi:asparagine synthase (glutamine-hydrolysing)
MCGIAGGYDPRAPGLLARLRHRGPDGQGESRLGRLWLGHTRLAVIDPSPASDQPFTYGRTTLVYNGECWNYRELRAELEAAGLRFATRGDTEVVAAALDRWGPEALTRLRGMFALAWSTDGEQVSLARDPFGEVPLYVSGNSFASERKALVGEGFERQSIAAVPPGTWSVLEPSGKACGRSYAFPAAIPDPGYDRARAAARLRGMLEASCRERSLSDVPVATLLSGGIDSALVAALLKPYFPGLVAYLAVMRGDNPDRRAARECARFFELPLIEVEVPPPGAAELAEVVRVIEQPYKAQVEIGWACLQLARRLREDGIKVVFSGEGSDELWASYGFAYHALKKRDFHTYRRDLFLGQAEKNFARCNKAFMAFGIECRLPFLNGDLVQFALSLPRAVVADGAARPKAVLQEAAAGLVPELVRRRPKAAFQDALGLKRAIARTLPDPARYYRAEYRRLYQ